jgi:hypothetical protein
VHADGLQLFGELLVAQPSTLQSPFQEVLDDQRLLRLMTKRVGVALRLQKDKGAVRAEQGPGQYMI